MSQPEVVIFENGGEVAQAALEHWLKLMSPGQDFWVSLAGGTTPKELYRKLAGQKLDWNRVHLLWGDERFVPPDHADSNYRMVKEALLDHVQVGASQPWPIEATAQASASGYESVLRSRPQGVDLCLLGMGDDGHTASLFPDTAALAEQERWAVANWVEKFNAHRLTMTYPYLNASQHVLFLITGAGKAPALKQVLQHGQHPAAGVRGQKSTVYFLDRAAAAQL